jgi:hypothetical protein
MCGYAFPVLSVLTGWVAPWRAAGYPGSADGPSALRRRLPTGPRSEKGKRETNNVRKVTRLHGILPTADPGVFTAAGQLIPRPLADCWPTACKTPGSTPVTDDARADRLGRLYPLSPAAQRHQPLPWFSAAKLFAYAIQSALSVRLSPKKSIPLCAWCWSFSRKNSPHGPSYTSSSSLPSLLGDHLGSVSRPALTNFSPGSHGERSLRPGHVTLKPSALQTVGA